LNPSQIPVIREQPVLPIGGAAIIEINVKLLPFKFRFEWLVWVRQFG